MEDSEGDGSSDRRSLQRSSSSMTTTRVHVNALDGIVSVNSLFTAAVFIGLSLADPAKRSLQGRPECEAGLDVKRNLLVFEVVSFALFLSSSLVAKGLKLAINLLNSKDVDDAFQANINSRLLRLGMLVSAAGSIMGCFFLLLSMVEIIQIRLGLLSCGGRLVAQTVLVLVVLISSALGVYICTIFYSFHK